jgi:hypothetical protein
MRIYRIISSFTEEESTNGLSKLPKETYDMLIDFVDKYYFYELRYDGKICHWREGDLSLSVGICPEEHVKDIKMWDTIIHEGLEGFTKIEDITDEVLYGKHDMDVYGFIKENILITFEDYIVNNITKDIILDKINLYGIDSLTENDKRILSDLPYIKYIDTIAEME